MLVLCMELSLRQRDQEEEDDNANLIASHRFEKSWLFDFEISCEMPFADGRTRSLFCRGAKKAVKQHPLTLNETDPIH